jgi:hypothetical protein
MCWVTKLALRSTAKCMTFGVVITVTACLSGCWALTGRTYEKESPRVDFSSVYPKLQKSVGGAGPVTLAALMGRLMALEIVHHFPTDSAFPVGEMVLNDATRVIDAIAEIERAGGWVYDPQQKDFYPAGSTHDVDDPDSFGRPRASQRATLRARSEIPVAVRFRRVSASAVFDPAALGLGMGGTVVELSMPDGVRGESNQTSERSYFETVRDTESGRALPTTRRAVQSGVILSALAARLPGQLFRLTGRLEISSFVGNDLNRAVVTVPLELDAPRGEWHRVYLMRGGNLNVQMAFQQFGFDLLASGEAVDVSVMVR